MIDKCCTLLPSTTILITCGNRPQDSDNTNTAATNSPIGSTRTHPKVLREVLSDPMSRDDSDTSTTIASCRCIMASASITEKSYFIVKLLIKNRIIAIKNCSEIGNRFFESTITFFFASI